MVQAHQLDGWQVLPFGDALAGRRDCFVRGLQRLAERRGCVHLRGWPVCGGSRNELRQARRQLQHRSTKPGRGGLLPRVLGRRRRRRRGRWRRAGQRCLEPNVMRRLRSGTAMRGMDRNGAERLRGPGLRAKHRWRRLWSRRELSGGSVRPMPAATTRSSAMQHRIGHVSGLRRGRGRRGRGVGLALASHRPGVRGGSHCNGAHVDTPTARTTLSICATRAIDPSLGRKRQTSVPEAGGAMKK